MKMRPSRTVVVCLALALAGVGAVAQTNNTCEGGESPDVIVGNLHQITSYSPAGSYSAYSVGTTSCNVGTCGLSWISGNNQHPVIAQHMYRLHEGRFEQIGQSWLKHGFFALSGSLCDSGCIDTNGTILGVNCSDPYSANRNGQQGNLGPKFEVNAHTGVFPYPPTDQSQTGNSVFKRLRVLSTDVEPTQNPGALYFVEGQYVTQDDAAADNQDNNASWREVDVAPGSISFASGSSTRREEPAIFAWLEHDPTVELTPVRVPNEGLLYLGSKVTDLGNGMWRYEYALHNLNSHRSIRSFSLPILDASGLANVGFHDVDYHSGEPWDGTDWQYSTAGGAVSWSTDEYATNQSANALRWGTLYNFRFDAPGPPVSGDVTLGVFRPGSPTSFTAPTRIPEICDGPDSDGDGSCDLLDPDDDNDGVEDGEDSAPLDSFVCRDADGDTCDDCSSGFVDPSGDGPDHDGDGLCDLGDPDDDNDGVADGEDGDPLDLNVCFDADGDGCDDCSQLVPSLATIADTGFPVDSAGFVYQDDTFRGTAEPAYATGSWSGAGGVSGGGLVVRLGEVDGDDITGMSGGWQLGFTLSAPAELEVSFSFNLTVSETYEADELGEALASFDGTLLGLNGNDYLAQLVGDGQGNGTDESTGWQSVTLPLGNVAAGSHVLTLGGYNNKKTLADEWTEVRFDDVVLYDPNPSTGAPDVLDDGPDADGDGRCDVSDCAPTVAGVGSLPAPIGPTLRLSRVGADAHLTWTRTVQAHTSNLYRGTIVPSSAWSYDEVCHAPGLVGNAYDDAGVPPADTATYYLVSARNTCGESAVGVDSASVERYASPACSPSTTDTDVDGLADPDDNCPGIWNALQEDADHDFVGDVCDSCPGVSDSTNADTDADGAGDACDSCTDTDGDGFGDPGFPASSCPTDNCPQVANPDQSDADADGVGDLCDTCGDDDGDGACATYDNCPQVANPDQSDADADGVGTDCDNCPNDANPDQHDADGDGRGDACDPCPSNPGACAACPPGTDGDGDGVCSTSEALLSSGSATRYLANVVDPGLGTTWTAAAFDDSSWATGSFGVGYETGGTNPLLATTVTPGALSVYARTSFTMSDPGAIDALRVGADYDDGYVVWLNGIEIHRSPEMPAGSPQWNTAAAAHESSNGSLPNYGALAEVSASALVAGLNELAVGVWNFSDASSDLVIVPLVSALSLDNCPGVPNPDQADADADGTGDACE